MDEEIKTLEEAITTLMVDYPKALSALMTSMATTAGMNMALFAFLEQKGLREEFTTYFAAWEDGAGVTRQ